MSSNAYSASEWAKAEPAGTRNASDIDYYVATINNASVDRLIANYREAWDMFSGPVGHAPRA